VTGLLNTAFAIINNQKPFDSSFIDNV